MYTGGSWASEKNHILHVAQRPSEIAQVLAKQLWREPTNQVKLHPGNKRPHLSYISFSLFTAENAAAWSSHCLLLGPLPQLYFWHALFLCSAGMLLRRRGWSRRASCRPSSHSFSWNIRTGIIFCHSQLLPLVSWSQLLKVVLVFKHPSQGFIPSVQLAAVSLVPSESSQTPRKISDSMPESQGSVSAPSTQDDLSEHFSSRNFLWDIPPKLDLGWDWTRSFSTRIHGNTHMR